MLLCVQPYASFVDHVFSPLLRQAVSRNDGAQDQRFLPRNGESVPGMGHHCVDPADSQHHGHWGVRRATNIEAPTALPGRTTLSWNSSQLRSLDLSPRVTRPSCNEKCFFVRVVLQGKMFRGRTKAIGVKFGLPAQLQRRTIMRSQTEMDCVTCSR